VVPSAAVTVVVSGSKQGLLVCPALQSHFVFGAALASVGATSSAGARAATAASAIAPQRAADRDLGP
jgi:hypothetical protein